MGLPNSHWIEGSRFLGRKQKTTSKNHDVMMPSFDAADQKPSKAVVLGHFKYQVWYFTICKPRLLKSQPLRKNVHKF